MSSSPATLPVWMRRGTLWVILALATGAFALVAYYLLPMWWAGLINAWVGVSGAWGAGILLGGVPVLIGAGSLRAALSAPRHPTRTQPATGAEARPAPAVANAEVGGGSAEGGGGSAEAAPSLLLRLRPALAVVTGLCAVILALTVFIAAGLTEPLRQARQVWREDAPGLLAATLVGALLGLIVILGVIALRERLRARRGPARDEPVTDP